MGTNYNLQNVFIVTNIDEIRNDTCGFSSDGFDYAEMSSSGVLPTDWGLGDSFLCIIAMSRRHLIDRTCLNTTPGIPHGHTPTHSRVRHAMTFCDMLCRTATSYVTLRHAMTRWDTLRYAATRHDTLQHAMTHSDTP